jgi:hypothetical protein
LKQSITIVQFNARRFVIQIGNNSGKEINGSTATKEYAALTNNMKNLRFRKNGQPMAKRNPNYHWVNKAIEQWIEDNQLNIALLYDDEEQEGEE